MRRRGEFARAVVLRAVTVLGVVGLFLLAPPVLAGRSLPGANRPVTLAPGITFSFNCDSPLFEWLAEDPGRLFQWPGALRQSRPLYVGAGAVLAAALAPIGPLLPQPLGAAWLGYVLLNFCILLVAVLLFDQLVLGAIRFAPVTFLVGVLLLVNDIVRGYFWTPHVQMFNVLVPLASLAASRAALTRPVVSGRWCLGVSILMGTGLLAYGSFAVGFAALVVSLLLRSDTPRGMALVRRLAAMLIAFALPPAAWVAVVVGRTGGFFYGETEQYREFVWLLDAARAGPTVLRARLVENVGTFVGLWWRMSWPAALLLAAVIALAFAGRVSVRRVLEEERATVIATGLVLVLNSTFFALLGFYHERLAWGAVPSLLVVTAVFVERLAAAGGVSGRLVLGLLGVIVPSWMAIEVLKPAAFG